MNADRLLTHYERIADAPDAIVRLRRFILDLAVRGKLVGQDPNDEPASELLKRIAAEKARLVKAGEIKKSKAKPVNMADTPFELPKSWKWAALGDLVLYDAGIKREPKTLNQELWLLELEDVEKDSGRLLVRVTASERESKSTKSEFCVDDILYGKLRPYLNKVLVADVPGYSTTEIVALRPFLPLCSTYCALALRRPDFVDYVTRLGQGTKMPRLRTEDATIAPFPLPPLAEQHRIVAKVDELMALCDRLEVARAKREATRDRLATASLARLNAPDLDPTTFRNHAAFALENLAPFTTRLDQVKALRQTVLNLAVRGKLVEQDPKDEPTGEALERIRIEREGLVQRKIIRRERPLAKIGTDEPPFEIPLQWRWKRIGEVALFTQYGTSTKSIPSEQGVPVLTMGNIQDGVVVWGNEKKIPATSDEFPALFLKKFDLLYNRTNSAELVGKTGIYLGEDDCKTFASYLIRVQLSKTSSSPRYMNLVMNAPVFRETQIIPLIKKQTGQANVNGTALKNMLVPLPPLPEQHRIVAKVDELMALCDRLGINLGIADTGRQHLLESLLRDVLVPSNEPCKVRRQ